MTNGNNQLKFVNCLSFVEILKEFYWKRCLLEIVCREFNTIGGNVELERKVVLR